MDLKNDISKIATCTSCQVKENKSNYWTAVLFFKHTNGSYIRVPQLPNLNTGSPNGGMTVYYIQTETKITAFPVGFRMITGNAMLRTESRGGPPKVTSFRCLDADLEDHNVGQPPGGGVDPVGFPSAPCEGVMRSQTYFPQCWDGVNLDSPDHATHVSFAEGPLDSFSGLNFYRGTCPKSHPIKLPMILFETIWNTEPFKDLWPADGSQPFVYSMGDPTGYGHHGDYMFGWEGDALQRVMDKCTEFNGDPTYCKEITVQSSEEINSCVQPSVVEENIEGYLETLPGCNPIQAGPAEATQVPTCNAVSTTKAVHTAPTAGANTVKK
ncbi:hypothetical protein EST38_g7702 [Candolleomyces aberdarensis]|uniref:DUF1996 domain-containing protein n=1 Tax=Candolleomyces aberdarensis TaxID=2316362 RepID=A0A4Q2DHV8_9AGAR|nr:hypothetical protein EST38_g7702 [Candolleomyces aberdarensis]